MADSVISRKLSTFRRVQKERGLFWILRSEIQKAVVWVLAKRYSFRPSWHPPTITRPYRQAIADAVNALHPRVVCEIGCGLGSILARLDAPVRIGYDIEPGVLKAARLIRSRSIAFHEGTIRNVSVPAIDVLILVNWIHEVPPEELERDLVPLLDRSKYLVVDAIDPDAVGYSHKHDFRFLKGRASEVGSFRLERESRTFLVYKAA